MGGSWVSPPGDMLPAMNAPLIVTADEALTEQLLRLCAAAGVNPTLAALPGDALSGWRSAPLVLVGTDALEGLAAVSPGRRDGVHVATLGRADRLAYPAALALGAEGLVDVSASEGWLVERLAEASEPSGPLGLSVGVLGGSGGAGASVFAAALASVASRDGPALLVDCDERGPGLDRLLGLELADGVRWDALHQTSGRLSARALRDSVPRRGGPGVLTWHSSGPAVLQPFAMREVLAAGARGHDTVVLDLPRAGGPPVDEAIARVDRLVLVVVPTVLGMASAARIAEALDGREPHAVVRGGGLSDEQVRGVTRASGVTPMAPQRGLDEGIDLGAGPLRSARGSLARAAVRVLRVLREVP